MDSLRQHMVMLYSQAQQHQDEDRATVIRWACREIELVFERNVKLIELLRRGSGTAWHFKAQRDIMQRLHDELLTAVANYVSVDPALDIVNYAKIPVDEQVAQQFHGWLVEDGPLDEEMKANLAEYMTWFVHEARRRIEVADNGGSVQDE